jgi:uncharacterized protein (UPF0261 family)
MPAVILLGSLDTKGAEYGYVRDRLRAVGVNSVLVDVGVLEDPSVRPDVPAETVARAANVTLAELRTNGDRGAAMAAMSAGAAVIVQELVTAGSAQGLLGLGGTGGTTLISHVMRTLPVGFPKVLVSTVASGDTSPYVGASDITMMYSVVDIAGINSISSRILSNAAGAIAGMVTHPAADFHDAKPIVGATMFGVTTPAVEAARRRLEHLGYEVLVFHATGTGGRSMENLVKAGMISGVLDLTTTELADELVGGVFSAGPDRLTAAARAGIPQVVSFGALDMVNFGPPDTVPAKFKNRKFHIHNASVTLMRTTPEENTEIGKRIAERLAQSTAPVTVMIPRRGFSALDVEEQHFYDPAADTALIQSFTENVTDNVDSIGCEADINDNEFAVEAADRLHQLMASRAYGELK